MNIHLNPAQSSRCLVPWTKCVTVTQCLSELETNDEDELEYITIDANVLCTNSKIVPASIYDWVAEVITDQGKYAIQLSNIKDTSYFNFSNVIYLNQNQSEIVLLNGKIPVKAMMLVDKYRGDK